MKIFKSRERAKLSKKFLQASRLSQRGKHVAAEEVYYDVLNGQIQLLGIDHGDTLDTMHNLAFTLRKLERYNEAVNIGYDLLEQQNRSLGPDHTNTLDTMHNLEFTLRKLERYDEAKKIGRHLLEQRKQVLGPNHIITLDTMYNLAVALHKLESYDESEKIGRDLLERQKQVLGPDHSDTLSTMHNLEVSFRKLEHYDKAEKIGRELFERRKRVLGMAHSNTIDTMYNLEITLRKLEQYDEADEISHALQKHREHVLGPDDQPNHRPFNFKSLYEALCGDTVEYQLQPATVQTRDWTLWIAKAGMIGMGGYGDVYFGAWKRTPAHMPAPPAVVIKTFRYAGSTSSKYVKFLKREIVILAGVEHPNIVPFVGVWYDNGNVPALVSLFMKNGDVKAYLEGNPEVDRRKINFEISQGLEYLHNHSWKIVHGDLKAANVLINAYGQACLTDFGLSMVVADGSLWVTSAVDARGTTRWMAPELLSGAQSRVDMPSDVYAFAMTSLEILTGTSPFSHLQHDMAVVVAVVMNKERPSRPEGCLVSDTIWQLWQECWSDKPADRPAMSEVVKRLKRLE